MATSGAIRRGLKGLQPPLQNHSEIQPQNLSVYTSVTQQIQSPPPHPNLVARLIANLMILNPCP